MHTHHGLSRWRDELKGVAILWVVLFHAKLVDSGALYEVTKIGYGGVDIFALLMGVGLYRSLDSAPELGGYLRRRFARLMPAYLPFCAAWLVVMLPTFGLSALQSARVALGNLSMLGLYAGVPKLISWYMGLMPLVIALAPFAYASLSRAKKPALCLLMWLAGATLVSVCFWGTELTIVFSRLPIFLLGMGLQRLGAPKGKPAARAALGFAAFAAGLAALYFCYARYPAYLNDCGMYWYPFFLIAPAMCAGLSWLMDRAGGAYKAFAPLRFLGKASLEIFLFNAWAEIVATPLGMGDTAGKRLLMGLASVVAGCLYHLVVAWISKRVISAQKRAG